MRCEVLTRWACENLAFYRAIEGYRLGNFRKPENSSAVIGGYRRQYRAIGGVWRAMRDPDENYIYSIALHAPTN